MGTVPAPSTSSWGVVGLGEAQHGGPETPDRVAVGGVEPDLEHLDVVGCGGGAPAPGEVADATREAYVAHRDAADVVAAQVDVDVRVAQLDVGVVVGLLGGRGDVGHQRCSGGEVAGGEAGVQTPGEHAPVLEQLGGHLVPGHHRLVVTLARLGPVDRTLDRRLVGTLLLGAAVVGLAVLDLRLGRVLGLARVVRLARLVRLVRVVGLVRLGVAGGLVVAHGSTVTPIGPGLEVTSEVKRPDRRNSRWQAPAWPAPTTPRSLSPARAPTAPGRH